jgi:hypothetical protein
MFKKKRRSRTSTSIISSHRLRLDGEVVRQLTSRELNLAIAGFCDGASIHSRIEEPGCAAE